MIQTNCVNDKKRNISKSSWDFRYKFATRLRCAREHQKLTQSDVAGKLDITLQAYQNFESLSGSNNREPKLEMVYKLSSILDCDIAYLMGENDDNIFRKDIANASEVTGLTNENIEKLNSLDNDNIEMLNILIGHNSFEDLLSSCWTFLHSHHNELYFMSSPYSKDFNYSENKVSKIYKFSISDTFSIMLEDMFESRREQSRIEYEQSLILEMIDCIQDYLKGACTETNKYFSVIHFERLQEKLREIQSISPYTTIPFDELYKQLEAKPIDMIKEIPNDGVKVRTYRQRQQ